MATKGELTVRQETFCRKFLVIGEATEAYRQSGYKHENYSDKSLWERASHLLADAKVAARVDELKAEAAKAQEITLEKVSTALRTALEQALDRGQSGAAVAAAMGLGKLGGLITEKQRIETVNEAEAHLQALRKMAKKRDKIDQSEKIQRRQVEAERDAADREAATQAASTFAKHLQNTDAKSL